MDPTKSRRQFLTMVGAGAAATAAAAPQGVRGQETGEAIKILAVCCSPRKAKTTATALQVCLDAAKQVAPARITTELIELADLSVPWEPSVGIDLEPGRRDDFPAIADKLGDASVRAIVIGTPVYFANMSALCKAFLDRCGMFRKQNFALSGKVGAVLAVGGVRSGGQELAIQSVQAALMCHEMIVVGDGRPTGHFGARLWNQGDDDILRDDFGIGTAENLGRHVAEVALA